MSLFRNSEFEEREFKFKGSLITQGYNESVGVSIKYSTPYYFDEFDDNNLLFKRFSKSKINGKIAFVDVYIESDNKTDNIIDNEYVDTKYKYYGMYRYNIIKTVENNTYYVLAVCNNRNYVVSIWDPYHIITRKELKKLLEIRLNYDER